MRFRLAITGIVFVAFVSLSAFAQPQWGRPHPPKVGACFYKDPEFRGDYFCMKRGDRWPSLPPGFNDRITSIRIFRDARVRLFIDNDFHGVSVRLNHDVADLHSILLPDNPRKSWNDRVSSIVVHREHDEWDRDGDRR
ncbi:MAG TPA: hypothetical protein VMI10_24415 [Terriglobales bacterium]|nr:hypothetical protein [Terriglobales bacterium]